MKSFLFIAALLACGAAHAVEPIKIGGMFSYTGIPSYMIPAQHAAEMAVEEQNAKGGVHGRPIKLIMRDDKYKPEEASKIAEELIARDKVALLFGESTTHIALAIVNVARAQGIPYFGAWCWGDECIKPGKDMVFTLDETPWDTLYPMVKHTASMPQKRWALLVPNIGYGLVTAQTIEKLMPQVNPGAKIVAKQIYADGNANFESVIRALQRQKVDGVITAVYGKDFAQYLIAAKKLGFLDTVAHLNTYMPPENMKEMGASMPQGWYVLGYPQEELKTPAHLAFLKKFHDTYHMMPGLSGLITYIDTKMALAALEKAPTQSPQDIAAAARGLSIDTPVGPVTFDPTQHSNLGYWYGTTDVKDGKPRLIDFYRSGEKQP